MRKSRFLIIKSPCVKELIRRVCLENKKSEPEAAALVPLHRVDVEDLLRPDDALALDPLGGDDLQVLAPEDLVEVRPQREEVALSLHSVLGAEELPHADDEPSLLLGDPLNDHDPEWVGRLGGNSIGLKI